MTWTGQPRFPRMPNAGSRRSASGQRGLRKFMGLATSQAVPVHCHGFSGQRFVNAHKHTLKVSVRTFANSRRHIPEVKAP